jgi:hypothetical protein
MCLALQTNPVIVDLQVGFEAPVEVLDKIDHLLMENRTRPMPSAKATSAPASTR